MFNNLKNRLSERDRKYFKLAVWACLIVWAVFFLVYSAVFSSYARATVLFTMRGVAGSFFAWVVPIWIVFTALLIIYYVARFAIRRLK